MFSAMPRRWASSQKSNNVESTNRSRSRAIHSRDMLAGQLPPAERTFVLTAFSEKPVEIHDTSHREYVKTGAIITNADGSKLREQKDKQAQYTADKSFQNALSLAAYDGFMTGSAAGQTSSVTSESRPRGAIGNFFSNGLLMRDQPIARDSKLTSNAALKINSPEHVLFTTKEQFIEVTQLDKICMEVEHQHSIRKLEDGRTVIQSRMFFTLPADMPEAKKDELQALIEGEFSKQNYPKTMADLHQENCDARLKEAEAKVLTHKDDVTAEAMGVEEAKADVDCNSELGHTNSPEPESPRMRL